MVKTTGAYAYVHNVEWDLFPFSLVRSIKSAVLLTCCIVRLDGMEYPEDMCLLFKISIQLQERSFSFLAFSQYSFIPPSLAVMLSILIFFYIFLKIPFSYWTFDAFVHLVVNSLLVLFIYDECIHTQQSFNGDSWCEYVKREYQDPKYCCR